MADGVTSADPSRPTSSVAAFFDLDRTILTVNSGQLWLARERRLGRIKLRHTLEAAFVFLGYHLGLVNVEASMRKALGLYQGVLESQLATWTREWYEREIAPHVAPGAWRALAEHRRAGHWLVLLTSSSPYASAAANAQLGLHAVLCSRYEVRDRRITGEPVLPFCYGKDKIGYAERWAAEHGVRLAGSFFYTDSYSDLPMLEAVGNPRVVQPDVRLRLVARRRGWPVLDWTR